MDEQLLDGNVARGCLERELEAAKRQLSNAGGEKQKLFDSLHALKLEVQEGARREAAAVCPQPLNPTPRRLRAELREGAREGGEAAAVPWRRRRSLPRY